MNSLSNRKYQQSTVSTSIITKTKKGEYDFTGFCYVYIIQGTYEKYRQRACTDCDFGIHRLYGAHHRKRYLGMDGCSVLYVRNYGLERLKGGNNGK